MWTAIRDGSNNMPTAPQVMQACYGPHRHVGLGDATRTSCCNQHQATQRLKTENRYQAERVAAMSAHAETSIRAERAVPASILPTRSVCTTLQHAPDIDADVLATDVSKATDVSNAARAGIWGVPAGEKNTQPEAVDHACLCFSLVPRRGLEPPHLAALVPETSASTNSATWACGATTVRTREPRIVIARPRMSNNGGKLTDFARRSPRVPLGKRAGGTVGKTQ
jgi:hypothetical protein